MPWAFRFGKITLGVGRDTLGWHRAKYTYKNASIQNKTH
jgi:hypothetical protein